MIRRHIFIILFPALAVCASCAHAEKAAPAPENLFIWEEANSRMATASSPQDFLNAASLYCELIDRQIYNGPVFFNLGTALLKAERYDDAILALRRAERYAGTSPDILRNMLLAVAARDHTQHPSLSWTRIPLFWHYGISCSLRLWIAAAAFFLLWVSLTMKLTGVRAFSNEILVISVMIVILFGSSAGTSLHEERNDRETRRPCLQLVRVTTETADTVKGAQPPSEDEE